MRDTFKYLTSVIFAAVVVQVALAGRLGSRWVKWSAALLLLGILQIVFAGIGAAVPVLGFLHAVNALAIYATVGLMAHRAWTQRPATEAAA